jgi:hypothetical protein
VLSVYSNICPSFNAPTWPSCVYTFLSSYRAVSFKKEDVNIEQVLTAPWSIRTPKQRWAGLRLGVRAEGGWPMRPVEGVVFLDPLPRGAVSISGLEDLSGRGSRAPMRSRRGDARGWTMFDGLGLIYHATKNNWLIGLGYIYIYIHCIYATTVFC